MIKNDSIKNNIYVPVILLQSDSLNMQAAFYCDVIDISIMNVEIKFYKNLEIWKWHPGVAQMN